MRLDYELGLEVIMAKKAYPLRINEDILAAMQRWSDDELRSLNAQIEYVLRDALRKSGRSKPRTIEPIVDPADD